ncbi:acetyl-CoA C-acyltransferase [Vitreoscilla filiformis]|nr:acetyl-CoA C-acyltransferase [Vitreoscilla filiformis]
MSSVLQDAYIVAASRTPVGKSHRGVFRHTRPDDLLVTAIRAALAQVPHLDPQAIEDAVIGCAMPEGPQGLNVARVAALLAGLPNSVGGMTVNRFCASGLSAIQIAADRIRTGEAEVLIAGGVESMSLVPMTGGNPSFNPALFANPEHLGIAYGMGLTAEKVAQRWQVSRDDQDAFALASHTKALAAQRAGEFAAEICPVDVIERVPDLATGTVNVTRCTVTQDEGPRPDTSLDGLAKLKPAFAAPRTPDGRPTGLGSVTAGNSSQTSDGAACLVLASERAVRQFDLQPLARFVGFACRGVAPEVMGIGPVEAIPAVLRRAGLSLDDLGWIELNEAFAAQALAVMRCVGLNPERVNPLGSAIALGHPLGATGAIRATTLVHALRRHRLRYGMVTMCVGTGQGAAGVLEAL